MAILEIRAIAYSKVLESRVGSHHLLAGLGYLP
jgi:hypothetical protein